MTIYNSGSTDTRQLRRLRVRRIRKRVVSASVALFVTVFLLIAVLLVSGHDPAIGHSRTAVASRATSTSASARGTTTSSSGSGGSATGSGSGLSSVTSSQS